MGEYFIVGAVLTGLFLIICTYTDLKNKYINIYICVLFGITGIAYNFIVVEKGLIVFLLSVLPGIFLMIISIMSRESVGKGDAIVVATIGLYIGGINTIVVLFNGVVVSCIIGIICMTIMKKEKNYRLPLIPFITLGYIFQIVSGGLIL